ncbi:MAG: peptidylprolyl isomerase [Fimbriimonas sp.]|nr:peptidylprolyl isomerase [Fimbriimonas sp.]
MSIGWMLLAPLLLIVRVPADKNPLVRIDTTLGTIVVEIDVQHAPATSANFLHYVDAKRYTKARFHRTVTLQNQPDKAIKIEVIQGGVNPVLEKADFPPIQLERTSVTGLRHRDGTISMARDGADTATSDFFICIGDQAELDFGGKRNPDGQGFAAFGKVKSGMEVVRKIQKSRADGQSLTPPVEILSITRMSARESGN